MPLQKPISKRAIETLMAQARRTEKQIELSDIQEPGLRIRAGKRSANWVLNCRLHNGKRTRIKLGSWPAMDITEARTAAQKRRHEILDGADPNYARKKAAEIARQTERAQRCLSEVLDEYEATHLSSLRRGAATRRALDGKNGLLRRFRETYISDISEDDVFEAVASHWKRAPIAANRNLAYAKAFFGWCKGRRIVNNNPATDVRKPAKERARDRVHSVKELRWIWSAAEELGYPFSQLVRLLIVVPMRREELAAIRLNEFTIENGMRTVWTLPASRTKSGNALHVPWPRLADRIVSEAIEHPSRIEDSPFLFSTTGDTSVSGFSKAKRRLDLLANQKASGDLGQKADGQIPHWTLHDLRSTFATLASEKLGAPMHVTDRMLNHVGSSTSSKIARIYNRSELFEPRRAVSNQWSDFLIKNVVSKSIELEGSKFDIEAQDDQEEFAF
ncbi:integrase family protein [uncultured Erythrobacter sp.]|uniref:tyrosine-type recombinase/integrase n=1 Tax=uncultured Erythrobacter sp. TaxID=263913 RepID=UPI002627EA65|nr:integrase family protein [uncultured Erythrobacter sp.]